MSKVNYIPFNKAYINVPVGKYKIQQNSYLQNGNYKIVDQGKSLVAGFSNEKEFLITDFPYILFGDHTKVIKYIDFPFIAGADGVRLYKASENFEPKFLYHYLRSINLPSDSYGRHSKYLQELLVPEFEISKQQKIVQHLDKQLSELEKAKNATVKTKQDLQTISKKQHQKALEILGGLPRIPLCEYLENIEAGKSIKTTEQPAKKDELGVLKVSSVSWDRFQSDEAKSVPEGYNPPDAHRVKKGDLIISRANTLELVGAVVLVEDDYPNRLLSDKTLRLITKSDIIPEYLLYVLKLPEARKHIEENATGTSNSMRNISQKTIYTIPIPQADEDQQRKIIELMQLTRTKLKKCETAMKLMMADLDLLPNKLLQEAFKETENE